MRDQWSPWTQSQVPSFWQVNRKFFLYVMMILLCAGIYLTRHFLVSHMHFIEENLMIFVIFLILVVLFFTSKPKDDSK